MATLTDRTIQAAKATAGKDEWLSDGGARGAGRLYLRVLPSGRKCFYYRCSGPDGERQALPLGEYLQKGGRAGLTLTDARNKAGEFERLYRSGIKDLRGYFEAEQKARERAQKDAENSAKRAEQEAKQGSLRNLLNGYTDHLERAGKHDARDVKGIFRLHVFTPWPDLADRKASEIKSADLRHVLGRLIDERKGRTAGKLRSYMRAAYAAAIRAENDATMPASLLGYGVEFNPCDALPALSQFTKAGDRTLTDEELRLYMVGIEGFPLVTRSALRIALYLGGQRNEQLLRVTPADVELIGEEEGEIRLRDAKGARKAPRLHVLPLLGVARAAVVELMTINSGAKFLFCNTEDTHLRSETMSGAAREISDAMMDCKRSLSPFKLSDIRRTCETMLARMGVSKDIRAQLLSHGLGGVQQRHYDRHEYFDEKRAALKAWHDKLNAIKAGMPAAGNVVEIDKARAA
jgi:integrase